MSLPSIEAVREAIAEYFENKANWRESVSRKYPEDVRNLRAMGAMQALAAHVRGLPDESELLESVRKIPQGIVEGVFTTPKPVGSTEATRAEHLVDQLGFHGEAIQPPPSEDPGAHHETFLKSWVSALHLDARDSLQYLDQDIL